MRQEQEQSYLRPVFFGILILIGGRFFYSHDRANSQTILSKDILQAMDELNTLNQTQLIGNERQKLLIATIGKENLTDKLLNPQKYFDCTYDVCTDILASGATIKPNSGNISQ